MQNFIHLQSVLLDPKQSFDDFKNELIKSQINQFTYLCLLLNSSVTIKRANFKFQAYLRLLTTFRKEPGYETASINYMGYKDSISILMNACQKSVASTVYSLVTHPLIKLQATDPNGLTAIFYSIKNVDENQSIKMLQIFKAINPTILNSELVDGYSLLFLAVQKLRIKTVEYLLKNGLNPNKKLTNGNSVIHELIKNHSKSNLEQLAKIIQIFAIFQFNFTLTNNLDKTIEQYAIDFRLNLTDFILDIRESKFDKNEFLSESCESQHQRYNLSSKFVQIYTKCNNSQIEESQFYQTDGLSISNKSLFSQMIGYQKQQQSTEYLMQNFQLNQVQNLQNLQNSQNFPISKQCQSQIDQSLSPEQYQILNDTKSNKSSQQQQQFDFMKSSQINHTKIDQQMLYFNQQSQQYYFKSWKQIQTFLHKLTQIVQPFGLYLQIIGSFATALWNHLSDIDIALVTISQNYVDFQRLLEKVYLKIKFAMYSLGIKQIQLHKSSKFSSINIDMDPFLYSSKKIDIMIFHKKNMGIVYVNYIRQSLMSYPQIKPIFFYLKRICEQFGLHDPFKGGLKSYSIFLMIFMMVRTIQSTNLSQLLLKISLYYGFYHQYDYFVQTRIDQNQFQEEFATLRLNIKDPLNSKNNMGGKNTDTYKIKNMFRSIFYSLHKPILTGTTLQYILSLAKIM